MSAKPRDLGMTPLDDLFSTDESRAEAQLEKVVTLNPADISDFPNHPFKVKQDEATPVQPQSERDKRHFDREAVAGNGGGCERTS